MMPHIPVKHKVNRPVERAEAARCDAIGSEAFWRVFREWLDTPNATDLVQFIGSRTK